MRPQKRSDQFISTEWPDGNTITLKAGTKYYMEILHKEGGGGDGTDATFIKEGSADPAQTVAGMFLLGSVIGTFVDVNGAKVDITTPPANVQGVEGKTVTFTVAADTFSPVSTTVSYQWLKNGAAIAGATKSSYKTPLLALTDSNSKYSVTISVPGVSKNQRRSGSDRGQGHLPAGRYRSGCSQGCQRHRGNQRIRCRGRVRRVCG